MEQKEQIIQKRSWLERAVGRNPLLVQAVGLSVVIIGATSLLSALWVSLIVAVHLILCEVIAAAALKKVPEWLRVAIYFALGIAIAAPATYFLDQAGSVSLATLRVFTPLLAANTIAVTRCERYAVRVSVLKALRDGIANALGFAAVAAAIGAAREILGAGTLWGRSVSAVHIRGFLMPYGGFLLLGAAAAALKFFLRVLGRQGVEEAMELAPEDRLERLEKKQQLMELEEPTPEPAPEEKPLPEQEDDILEAYQLYLPKKPIPVERILGDLEGIQLEKLAAVEERAKTAAEKRLLMEELESLLDEFR